MYLWHETHDAENAGRLEYQIALYFIDTLFTSQYQICISICSNIRFEDIYIQINIYISCLSFVLFKIYTFITSFFVSNSTKQCIDKMVCSAYTNMNINHHNQQLPYIVQITYQGRLCFVISHMSQKNQLNIVLYDSYYATHTI